MKNFKFSRSQFYHHFYFLIIFLVLKFLFYLIEYNFMLLNYILIYCMYIFLLLFHSLICKYATRKEKPYFSIYLGIFFSFLCLS